MLSCHKCNDKIAHDTIPVEKVLDPCKDSDEEIQRNITFEGECIHALPGSKKGLSTIKKFHLDSDALDLKRGRLLNVLKNVIIDFQKKGMQEQRKELTPKEKQQLLTFTQRDQPYSLMCEIYLRKYLPEQLSIKQILPI